MKRIFSWAVLGAAIVLIFSSLVYAEKNFMRTHNIWEKEYEEDKQRPTVFGVLGNPPPNNNNCNSGGLDQDSALTFNIGYLEDLVGDSFDVNKIYVDAIGSDGENALRIWLKDWAEHQNGAYELPRLTSNDSDYAMNWQGKNNISVCVGGLVRYFKLDPINSEKQLELIFLWYDGPAETTMITPVPGGPSYDMSKPEEAIEASGNGQTASGLLGPGTMTSATEEPAPGLPDFVLNKVQLTDSQGHEHYAFNITETVQLHAYAKNIGDADWAGSESDIYVKFYLSKGYKEDPHSEWKCVGTQEIQRGNLNEGVTKHEQDQIQLARFNDGHPITPGIYNIVACVDRESDQNNGDGEVPEIHESNNCSTEAVFEAKIMSNLGISQAQFTGGRTQFDPGEVVNFSVIVASLGEDISRDTTVTYALNGAIFATDNILGSNLASGMSKMEDVNVTMPMNPGSYVMRVCADGYNVVQETVEMDNCREVSINVGILWLMPIINNLLLGTN